MPSSIVSVLITFAIGNSLAYWWSGDSNHPGKRYAILEIFTQNLTESYPVWRLSTLGKMFTYEVSVQKDHKLMTGGPYSIVRHPSYFGMILIASGVFIWQSGPASWTRLSGILNHWRGKALVAVCAAWMTALVLGAVKRVHTEDTLMREEFGDQWTEWASRTYLLIPWVY
ncbi:hypothetical protein BDP27DRAFT_1368047 [Rhodocollybia butyracea]|uniref:Protein-S-isoprenylcysteine O-methyltransferase n=1 Tax=Rhodocollybia butyracea TaxID=206335 RepID=A0A9P5PHD3_9AGAR|nr:hypothetical protein BDP27DRAFT_1368047 [Rhodocollybia butyracea]